MTLLILAFVREDAYHDSQHVPALHRSIDSMETLSATRCPNSVNEKALLRKIDLRVIPILFILYFAAFLDRYRKMFEYVMEC